MYVNKKISSVSIKIHLANETWILLNETFHKTFFQRVTSDVSRIRLLAGVSLAMNELRPCAPLSLKHVLAQQIVGGLQEVSDALLHYNSSRILRDNESALFLSLCQVFIEVMNVQPSSPSTSAQRLILQTVTCFISCVSGCLPVLRH